MEWMNNLVYYLVVQDTTREVMWDNKYIINKNERLRLSVNGMDEQLRVRVERRSYIYYVYSHMIINNDHVVGVKVEVNEWPYPTKNLADL